MEIQQGDVLLYQTNDDGEVDVVNGITQMVPGFETAVYLSMFGGNDFDSGSDNNANEYWGNFMVDTAEEKYRSETQFLLNTTPPITANLRAIHDAVQRDLAWMISVGVATEIIVEVSMIGIDRVHIDIQVIGERPQTLQYEANWLASVSQ